MTMFTYDDDKSKNFPSGKTLHIAGHKYIMLLILVYLINILLKLGNSCLLGFNHVFNFVLLLDLKT